MTVTEDTGVLAPAAPRDNAGLLMMLDQIGGEGWDGPTGRRLLTFVRERLARPLAVGAGLRGLAASQAEASAWHDGAHRNSPGVLVESPHPVRCSG